MTASSVWRLVRSVLGYLAVFALIFAGFWVAINEDGLAWRLPLALVAVLVGCVIAMDKVTP